MKKILSLIILAFSSVAFVACTNEKKVDKSYEDYKVYVSERRDSMDGYFDDDWNNLERDYDEKRMKAEANMNDWDEETRAEYAALQSDWDSFREDYSAERERRDAVVKSEAVVNNLLPQGVSADLNNVNAANLLEVHKHLVEYVEVHKDEFTREQWDRIEFMWEGLGTRKNEVEKELKSGDNLKIAELKIKYSSIKATNKPVAKADENSEAKTN